MSAGINAKQMQNASIEDFKRVRQENAGENGQVEEATQENTSGKSIFNVYATDDANQNGYIEKNESQTISNWKPLGGSDAQTQGRNIVDRAVTAAGNAIGNAWQSLGEMQNNVKSKVYTLLADTVIGKFTQLLSKATNFQALDVGFKSVEVAQGQDINTVGQSAQSAINQIAEQGIKGVTDTFAQNMQSGMSEIIDFATNKAKDEILSEINNGTSDQKADAGMKKINGTREVNGEQMDVYMKDGKHYIKQGNDFQEVFIVTDGAKRKTFVTADRATQMGGFNTDNEGKITGKDEKNNKFTQIKVDGEDERIAASSSDGITFNAANGKTYVLGNDSGEKYYFEANTQAGILIQNGGSFEGRFGGVSYNGTTYEFKDTSNIRNGELKGADAAIKQIQAKQDAIEMRNIDADMKDTRLSRQQKQADGLYKASDFAPVVTTPEEETTPVEDTPPVEEEETVEEETATRVDDNRDEATKKADIQTANATIRNEWGGRAGKDNKAAKEALGEDFGGTNTAKDAVNKILTAYGYTSEQISTLTADGSKLMTSVIKANPNVFNPEGKIYNGASMDNFDFPSKATIDKMLNGEEITAPQETTPTKKYPMSDKLKQVTSDLKNTDSYKKACEAAENVDTSIMTKQAAMSIVDMALNTDINENMRKENNDSLTTTHLDNAPEQITKTLASQKAEKTANARAALPKESIPANWSHNGKFGKNGEFTVTVKFKDENGTEIERTTKHNDVDTAIKNLNEQIHSEGFITKTVFRKGANPKSIG